MLPVVLGLSPRCLPVCWALVLDAFPWCWALVLDAKRAQSWLHQFEVPCYRHTSLICHGTIMALRFDDMLGLSAVEAVVDIRQIVRGLPRLIMSHAKA